MRCRLSKQALPKFAVTLIFAAVGISVSAIVRHRRLALPDGAHLDESRRRQLLFSTEGTFKIMQLTDTHLGEGQATEWGPENDRETFALLTALIQFEDPDLLLLSGDLLTGNNCDENATAYYKQLGDFVETFGIPWALAFGNHDDADFEHNGTRSEAKTKRPQLAQTLDQFPLSLTQVSPSNVTGISNYILPIFESSSTDDVWAQVAVLDSGGGSIPYAIDASQVDWLRRKLDASPLPTAVFQHIPTAEFQYDSDRCIGTHKDGVASVASDGGLMEYLKSNSNVMFLAVGHQHGNDYCCHMKNTNLRLCFGRHSGYGGYAAVSQRGARVYELDSLGWTSWVRLESGDIVNDYEPIMINVG